MGEESKSQRKLTHPWTHRGQSRMSPQPSPLAPRSVLPTYTSRTRQTQRIRVDTADGVKEASGLLKAHSVLWSQPNMVDVAQVVEDIIYHTHELVLHPFYKQNIWELKSPDLHYRFKSWLWHWAVINILGVWVVGSRMKTQTRKQLGKEKFYFCRRPCYRQRVQEASTPSRKSTQFLSLTQVCPSPW
jgi:hypothetical protein